MGHPRTSKVDDANERGDAQASLRALTSRLLDETTLAGVLRTVVDVAGHVVADDLRTETRWPECTAVASRHGVRAVLAAAFLHTGAAQPTGALTLYSRRPGGLTAADRNTALLLVTHGSLAIARCRATEQAELMWTTMKRAMRSRDVIGQAKGILTTRQGISAEAAFDLLRRTSRDQNVKVVDLARTFVAVPGELG